MPPATPMRESSPGPPVSARPTPGRTFRSEPRRIWDHENTLFPSYLVSRDRRLRACFKISRRPAVRDFGRGQGGEFRASPQRAVDRKSTRLNSSHLGISYAVFCLKKKKKKQHSI